MSTKQFENVTLSTHANVYFDGKCVSHNFTLPDGSKKSVGVVLASQLVFNTGAAEIMECVQGSCSYKLKGQNDWTEVHAGERFHIEANSSFDILVKESFHYICHYA
jgi:uncharacterized protein YaiE (UPF0345 family)